MIGLQLRSLSVSLQSLAASDPEGQLRVRAVEGFL